MPTSSRVVMRDRELQRDNPTVTFNNRIAVTSLTSKRVRLQDSDRPSRVPSQSAGAPEMRW